MPIFKRLFGSERKAATKPDSTGAVGASRSTGRGLIKLISGRPSLLSDITAALGRPPVDGAILLDDITKALRRHVWLPDDGAEIVALFVLHAHAREAARISPMLAFASPEIACGKTTALSVVSKLTPQPLFVSDLTPAGLYRAITNAPCTLLIDEGKSALRGHRTLSSLLNSGHRRDGARVLRADGVFDLYCPKAIALVGELPASLKPRSPTLNSWACARQPGPTSSSSGWPTPIPSFRPAWPTAALTTGGPCWLSPMRPVAAGRSWHDRWRRALPPPRPMTTRHPAPCCCPISATCFVS